MEIALGIIYLDLLAVEPALHNLSQATDLAKAIGSQVWIVFRAAYLAATYTTVARHNKALALLDEFLPPDTAMQMQWQRLMWYACAKHYLPVVMLRPLKKLPNH